METESPRSLGRSSSRLGYEEPSVGPSSSRRCKLKERRGGEKSSGSDAGAPVHRRSGQRAAELLKMPSTGFADLEFRTRGSSNSARCMRTGV
ncbi:hypothetical protein NL676_022157 [Syzygium grande]|nr:hypothetical protein NL676_022157 [Syzygium grande]